jgi:hypothetical protein
MTIRYTELVITGIKALVILTIILGMTLLAGCSAHGGVSAG